MPRMITERQTKYLAALMSRHLGNLRKAALKAEWGVESTKDLTFEQAYEAISKLNPDGFNESYKAKLERKALDKVGQENLFKHSKEEE